MLLLTHSTGAWNEGCQDAVAKRYHDVESGQYEAEILGRLRQLCASGNHDGAFWVVMHRVPGVPLAKFDPFIQARDAQDVGMCKIYMGQIRGWIADAILEARDKARVIHGCVFPAPFPFIYLLMVAVSFSDTNKSNVRVLHGIPIYIANHYNTSSDRFILLSWAEFPMPVCLTGASRSQQPCVRLCVRFLPVIDWVR